MSVGLPAPRRVDIRAMRERFGLTQADVADELHVDERTVRRWERGASSPSPMAIAHMKSLQRRMQQQQDAQSPGLGAGASGAPSFGDRAPRDRAGQQTERLGEGAHGLPRRRLPSL